MDPCCAAFLQTLIPQPLKRVGCSARDEHVNTRVDGEVGDGRALLAAAARLQKTVCSLFLLPLVLMTFVTLAWPCFKPVFWIWPAQHVYVLPLLFCLF